MNNPEGIKALVAEMRAAAGREGSSGWRQQMMDFAHRVESLTAVAEPEEESRAITALKVTLFETECYLPASIAKRVQAACAVGVAGDAEVVAWRSKMPGDTVWLITAHEPTPPGIIKEPLYTHPPTRQAVEGMVLGVPTDKGLVCARCCDSPVIETDTLQCIRCGTELTVPAAPQAGKGNK